MKPPMKSDAGPTAWIVYDQEVARRSLQESLVKNQTLEHLPFLVILEQKSKSLIVPEVTSRSLSVIKKRSQAISLVPKIIDVVAKKRSPRRRKITMAKATAKPATDASRVEHPDSPQVEDGRLVTTKMWKTFSAVLGALLLFLLCWHYATCKNCKESNKVIDEKSKGSEQAAVVKQPTRVPTEVPTEAKGVDYQRLVIHNGTSSAKTVTVILKGKEKTFSLNPGEMQGFRTYELTAKVMIEGEMQDPIPLKRFGERKFVIRG